MRHYQMGAVSVRSLNTCPFYEKASMDICNYKSVLSLLCVVS